MAKKTINRVLDFEILDHGYDGASYFQGCGTSFTDYNHVVTGRGDNQYEAADDAIGQMWDSLYTSGHDGLNLKTLQRHLNAHYSHKRIPAWVGAAFRESEECELGYFFSIRYNLHPTLEAENEAAIKAFRDKHNAGNPA